MADIVDSYSETNRDALHILRGNHPSADADLSSAGQSFTCDDACTLDSVKFYMMKTGSPTGTAYVRIYAHSGTYGTSSVPTGDPLANSDGFDVSTLTGSFALITFSFSGAERISLSASTYYCVTFENPSVGTINAANYVRVGTDASSPAHDGNTIQYKNSAWEANNVRDTCFYVYSEAAAGVTVLKGSIVPLAMTTLFSFAQRRFPPCPILRLT